MKVADFANYTAVPTQAQTECFKQQGIGKVVIGTSYGDVWKQQIAACRLGGLQVAEFQFPQALKPPVTGEWWCDVEKPPGATINQVRAACNRIPQPTGLYSSRVMWDACGLTGWNVKHEFPWLKLWMADYGSLPRPFRPFGGFSEDDVVMVQYSGNQTICGLLVDLSVALKEEEDMEFSEQNKKDIAEIVRLEVLRAVGTLQSGDGDTYKHNIGEIVKVQAELMRQDMERTGQLKPRQ